MGGVSHVASRSRSDKPQLTPFHQRIAAESLTARGGGGTTRLAPALAHSAVDLNPHQIEAAAFALAALPTGGAVLADEVGLGKTVEAGIVLAQLAAEGKARAIILVPASLRAQWRDELRSKFGLDAEVVDGDSVREKERQGLRTNPFDTGGIVISSHPFAALRQADIERVAWDVAVIDEAHRLRNAYRKDHRTGQALRRRRCARRRSCSSPPRRSRTTSWSCSGSRRSSTTRSSATKRRSGLQYVTGELTEDRAADLKARLAPVFVRTLRRQVREYVKFTARRSIVEDFAPTAQEQELYDRVSEYLRREDAYAIPQARRQLFVLVYRKILASSSFALAATLDRLADTLDEKVAGVECSAQADLLLEMDGFADEVEELFDDPGASARPKGQAALRRMNDELDGAPGLRPARPRASR